jgi:hypothetical protein
LPEYSDYPEEEPKKISISSAWFKTEWWFKDTIATIKLLLDGKNAGFFATDYLTCVKHGIKTKRQIETERAKSDPISFAMEYENIPSGQSGRAYYKLNMFKRNIKKAFYPLRTDMYTAKKNIYSIPKIPDELRIVACDVATRANKMNDNSVFACIRLLPTHKGYQRQLVYMESSHGANTVLQALRAKDIFYDFGADFLVLDLAQAGISLFDTMSSITRNEERGIEYPAFTVMEALDIDDKVREELFNRTLAVNALPVVYPISGTLKLNSEMAVAFRNSLQKRMWEFLITDSEAEDYLIKTNKEYIETKDDMSLKTFLLHPYVQTNLFVSECINLEMQMLGGNIKLVEPTSMLKDRYTVIAYANWLVSQLDRDLLKEVDNQDDFQELLALTQFV